MRNWVRAVDACDVLTSMTAATASGNRLTAAALLLVLRGYNWERLSFRDQRCFWQFFCWERRHQKNRMMGADGELTDLDEQISHIVGCLGRSFHENNLVFLSILLCLFCLDLSLCFHIAFVSRECDHDIRVASPLKFLHPGFGPIE